MTDAEIMQRTNTIALMAATLEAGDRYRYTVNYYVGRASELYEAAETLVVTGRLP